MKYQISNKKIQNCIYFKHNNENSLMEKLPKKIQNILTQAQSYNYEELHNSIENCCGEIKEFSRIGNGLFKYKNYYIKLTDKEEAELYKYLMPKLEKANITIAPKYIDSVFTKENFAVLVYSIEGTEEGELLELWQGKHLLPKKSKNEYYNNINKLLNLNIGNYALMNQGEIKITPDPCHKIVCDNWNNLYNLSNCDPEFKKDIYEKCKQRLI